MFPRALACILVVVSVAGLRLFSVDSAQVPAIVHVDPPGGPCTLANALLAVQIDAPVGGCNATPGSEVVSIPAGVFTVTDIEGAYPDDVITGLPLITTAVVLRGAGADQTIIERDPDAPAFRLLRVLAQPGASLVVEGLTLRNGLAADWQGGGAILAGAPLKVVDVTFDSNQAGEDGGGAIRGRSVPLAVQDSRFVNNFTTGVGGAIGATGGPAHPLTVVGSSFTRNRAARGGAIDFTSFDSTHSGSITDSTFEENIATFDGGALRLLAVMSLSNLRVSRNQSSSGGGLYGDGLTITDSTFDGNSAQTNGGGIATLPSSVARPVTIAQSTIANNVVTSAGGSAGGLYLPSPVRLVNVTVSGNRAAGEVGQGGGILVTGAVEFQNVTITNNAAARGGGVQFNGFPVATLANTIIAGNSAGVVGPDCLTGFTTHQSNGFNLIGIGDGCAIATTTGDQVGSSSAPIDPLLGPLAFNGGPTATHEPALNSPAVDAGNPQAVGTEGACASHDQRGVARPRRHACDIGAVERENRLPSLVVGDLTVQEDSSASIEFVSSDADGDEVSVRVLEHPQHGEIVGTGSSLQYVPSANYFGDDSFVLVADDSFADGLPATVHVTVLPVNDPPHAADDMVTSAPDAVQFAIDVLANDSIAPDVDEQLVVTSVTQGAQGKVSVGADGQHVIYAPAPGFVGEDTFTYTVSDGNGGTASASVRVAILRPNVQLLLRDSPDPAPAGGSTVYRATILNTTAVPIDGAVLTLTAEPSLAWDVPTNCTVSGATVTCSVGVIAGGSLQEVALVATAQSTALHNVSAEVVTGVVESSDADNRATETTAFGSVIVVNSTSDATDPTPFDNICNTDAAASECTLRAALLTANAQPGSLIAFNIPPDDPGFNGRWFTIRPGALLPMITAARTIVDGTTQRAFGGDTNEAGPEIAIDGAALSAIGPPIIAYGLNVAAPDVLVRHLTIGGVAPSEPCEVICAAAVFISSPVETASSVRIEGSYLGVAPDATEPSPNDIGVLLHRVVDAVIGGVDADQRNVIANNRRGVVVTAESAGVTVTRNTFYGNTVADIDLNDDGHTPNDEGDLDESDGGNHLQNIPQIDGVASSGGDTTVAGVASGVPNEPLTIELFSSASCGPANRHGVFLHTFTVVPDESGSLRFKESFPGALPPSSGVSATATDAAGHTSEMSSCAEVNGAGTTDVRVSIEAPASAAAGVLATWRMVVSNDGVADAHDVRASFSFAPTQMDFRLFGCARNGQTLECEIPHLPAGASQTFEVLAAPLQTIPLTTTAYAEGAEPDTEPTNNSTSFTTEITAAVDLEVLTLTTEGLPRVGEPLTFHFQITNRAGSTATQIVATHELPSTVDVIEVSPGCTPAGGHVVCLVDSLPANHTASLMTRVIPHVAGPLSTSVSVTAHEVDTNTDNNAKALSVTVGVPLVDLAVTIAESADPIDSHNDELVYSITFRNLGEFESLPATATITLTGFGNDEFALTGAPVQLGQCSQSVEGGTRRHSCLVGNLAGSSAVVLQLSGVPETHGSRSVEARIESSSPETPARLLNNLAVEQTQVNPGVIQLEIDEQVHVVDDLTAEPVMQIAIDESVKVHDDLQVTPPIQVNIDETLRIVDELNVQPPIQVEIAETIGISDDLAFGNTIAGANVAVALPASSVAPAITVTFTAVTAAGNTTVAPLTDITLPAGFALGQPPILFDLSTTASFTPPATVCVSYEGVTFLGAARRFFHLEDGRWVDRTVSDDPATMTLCASVSSLSPFAVLSSVDAPGRFTGSGHRRDDDIEHRVEVELSETAKGQEFGSLTYTLKSARGKDRGEEDRRGKDKDSHDTSDKHTGEKDKRAEGKEDRFEMTSIDALAFASLGPARQGRQSPASVTINGTGKWNGKHGYWFTATLVDQGEPGRGNDVMSIAIFDSSARFVAGTSGVLEGGNFQWHPSKK